MINILFKMWVSFWINSAYIIALITIFIIERDKDERIELKRDYLHGIMNDVLIDDPDYEISNQLYKEWCEKKIQKIEG